MPRLEQEIKQKKPFSSHEDRALVNLKYTAMWLTDQLNAYFKPFEITPSQYNILRILKGNDGPLTTSSIRHRMLERKSDTTRIIERMRKKGWLTQCTNKGDRRLVDIMITDKGSTLLDIISSSPTKINSIMSSLTQEECKQLAKLLDKLRDTNNSAL